jgi:hypothetical protein
MVVVLLVGGCAGTERSMPAWIPWWAPASRHWSPPWDARRTATYGPRRAPERFPISWNRKRFQLIGNARTGDIDHTGHIPFG